MKKIICITIIIVLTLSLCGCSNTYDTIEIYNKSASTFDNIFIDIKNGYFYDKHEKFAIDENTVGVTIYFSKNDGSEWKLKGGAE